MRCYAGDEALLLRLPSLGRSSLPVAERALMRALASSGRADIHTGVVDQLYDLGLSPKQDAVSVSGVGDAFLLVTNNLRGLCLGHPKLLPLRHHVFAEAVECFRAGGETPRGEGR